MKKLNDRKKWESDIYEILTTDPVVGGSPSLFTKKGIANIPHLQLANRTQYLKDYTEKIQKEVDDAKLGYETLADKLASMITDKKAKPFIIAKKGYEAILPENSIAAFSQAIEMETKHLHADLNITSDNMPILYGHESLANHTTGSGLTCNVCYCDLKFMTYKLCNSWDDMGIHIPTLEKFLQLVSSQVEMIYLDITKTRSTLKVVNHILPLLYKYGMESNTTLITDSLIQMQDIREYNKNVALCLLTDSIIYKKGRNVRIDEQLVYELNEIGNTSVLLRRLTYLCVFSKLSSQEKYSYLKRLENKGVNVIIDKDEFTEYEVQLALRAGLTKFLSKSKFSLTNKSI